jgi:hypothetical protein
MKQRHIQSFLMVSAAFLAINVPMRAGGTSVSPVNASPAQQVSPVRIQTAQNRASAAQDSEAGADDSDD